MEDLMEIYDVKYNRPLRPDEGQVPFEVKYGGRMVFLAYATGPFIATLVVIAIMFSSTLALLTAFTVAIQAMTIAIVGAQKMTIGHKPQFEGRQQIQIVMEQIKS